MRFKKKVDASQGEIVDQLRSIPGVSVELDHDDILVGRVVDGIPRTFWFELKNKKPCPSDLRKSQKKLLENYKGHYEIVWSIEQILESIGVVSR